MTRDSLAILGGEPAVTLHHAWRWPPVTDEEIQTVTDMMRRGELSYYGREGEVARLEDAFCAYLGVRYGLAVSSGTAALHSAFFAAGLRPGDEVLAPTYTFLATVMPIFVANGVPVLVDAEPDTGNADPADIERRVTPRTKALVITHMWGQPCDMDTIVAVARRHNLVLIEDCSHAHGASYNGRKVGTFGDIAIFSFQAKKLVSAGQGGILVTDNQEMFERAVLLGHFKVRSFQDVLSQTYRPYASTGFGLNYRMHSLAAAMARIQLGYLETRIAARHANFDPFSAALQDIPGVQPPVVPTYTTRHALYSYKPLYRPEDVGGLPIDAYVAALRAEGVDIERSETVPLHKEPIFRNEPDPMLTYGHLGELGVGSPRPRYNDGDFPGSEQYAARALVLPAFTEPVGELLEQYLGAFRKVADQSDRLATYWRNQDGTREPVLAR